jgi:hypothetical protein
MITLPDPAKALFVAIGLAGTGTVPDPEGGHPGQPRLRLHGQDGRAVFHK